MVPVGGLCRRAIQLAHLFQPHDAAGEFGGAPIACRGKLIANSGYGSLGKMPGNVLLVYDVK